jgi:hypothetical protein
MGTQHEPLFFSETLDRLADWEGRDVLVAARVEPPGVPGSHSQLTQRGTLGPVQMVDNQIDPGTESVAAYEVEGTKGGLYVSPEDFVRAVPLSDSHLKLTFKHDLHIEVQLSEG